MTRLAAIALFCTLLAVAAPLAAADLGAPGLSPPLAALVPPPTFNPERFLTTGGLKFSPMGPLTLEPELGVGYRLVERDLAGGSEEATHQLHAQAGGRLSLGGVYLSAAAKLPVYTYAKTGDFYGRDVNSRQAYDIARPLRNPLTWTGEVGVRLSRFSDLTLYYDQSLTPGTIPGLQPQQEERIGTRLILHFK